MLSIQTFKHLDVREHKRSAALWHIISIIAISQKYELIQYEICRLSQGLLIGVPLH